MSNVGTRKVFESDELILWEFLLEPGEATELHTHERDYVFYVANGSTLKVAAADGESSEFSVPDGAVMAFRLEGDKLVTEDNITVPATHSTENVGDTLYKEVLVEMKKGK